MKVEIDARFARMLSRVDVTRAVLLHYDIRVLTGETPEFSLFYDTYGGSHSDNAWMTLTEKHGEFITTRKFILPAAEVRTFLIKHFDAPAGYISDIHTNHKNEFYLSGYLPQPAPKRTAWEKVCFFWRHF